MQEPVSLQKLLDGNDIRGPGMAVLKEQPELIDLSLSGTSLADAGIKPLFDLTNLKRLDLRNTKVTAAKIDELKQALPKCRIEWDGGVIEP